jgi:SAM-dependent methyltransferase
MTTTAPDSDAAFRAEFARFGGMSRSSARFFELNWDDRLPCHADCTAGAGFDRHYIYHTAWAARVLARLRPAQHIDIASSLYFASIASAFVPTRYYEYRPVDLYLPNLSCDRADLTALPFADRSIASLSCMHVVEHVGLGRYGDELDPDGDLRATSELARVLAPGGSLLLVVPVGRPRVQFNAHRIYAFDQVRDAFAGLDLAEFALVPDRAYAERNGSAFIANASKTQADAQRYGCGCFRFWRGA